MNVKFKLIAILLVIAIFCASLAACSSNFYDELESNESYSDIYSDTNSNMENNNQNNTNSQNGTNNNSYNSDNQSTEKIPSDAFILFQNGKYEINAIMPDRPTDIENTVYAKLRSKMKSKTGTTLQTTTDYLKTGEKHSTSTPEILVGLTNYTESKSIYEDMNSGTYGIKFSGKKIVFYFSGFYDL